MLCRNPRCRAMLGRIHWGEGFCSRACMMRGADAGSGPLLDPTDPTGGREIARDAGQVEAMLRAYEIDPRLPRVIHLRRRGWTFKRIGESTGLHAATCNRILAYATPNLLRECGLRPPKRPTALRVGSRTPPPQPRV